MKYIFRVYMDNEDLDDCFYFSELPSKNDVIKAIKENRNIAPEYSFFYDNLEKAAELCDWPTIWPSGLAETGKGIYFDGKNNPPFDVYIRIGRFRLRDRSA